MNNLLESLGHTETALQNLRTFFESLPPSLAAQWDIGSPCENIDTHFIQLHPGDALRKDAEARRTSALTLARAWGGTWTRFLETHWRGDRPAVTGVGITFHGGGTITGAYPPQVRWEGASETTQSLILHDVEPRQEKTTIDLSVVPNEPERDEVPAAHTLERAALAEAREIRRNGMPEPWEGRP